jgi:hypothetical protein
MKKKQPSVGIYVLFGIIGLMFLYFGSDFNSTRDLVDLSQLLVGLMMIGAAIFGYLKISKKA